MCVHAYTYANIYKYVHVHYILHIHYDVDRKKINFFKKKLKKIQDLPPALRKQTFLELFTDVVHQVPIFAICSEQTQV